MKNNVCKIKLNSYIFYRIKSIAFGSNVNQISAI